jgi:hypothetical protein
MQTPTQGLPVKDIPLHAKDIVDTLLSYEMAHYVMTGSKDFKFVLHVVDGYVVSFLPTTYQEEAR